MIEMDTYYTLPYTVGKLSNGIVFAHRYLNVPDICLITRVNEGSMHEPDDKQGILHLIEHLFYRSSRGENLKQRIFQITGRDIPDAYTHPEEMVFSARMAKEDFKDYLNLWGETLKNGTYHKEDFEHEKMLFSMKLHLLKSKVV